MRESEGARARPVGEARKIKKQLPRPIGEARGGWRVLGTHAGCTALFNNFRQAGMAMPLSSVQPGDLSRISHATRPPKW